MMVTKQSWGKLLGRMLLHGVILGVCVFVAVHAAMAREGERGGHTRTSLTVAGSLMLPPGVTTPSLTFRFYRGQIAGTAPLSCGPITVPSTDVGYTEATHSFSAEVSIDTCRGLFNGENVWVTTTVTNSADGGVLLPETPRSAINPVPYARYADQYGTPDCPVGYDRVITPSVDGFSEERVRRLCVRGPASNPIDEVVRVGSGATAFWIDRYEAVVRDVQGAVSPSSSALPPNGQWYPASTVPVLAAWSQRGVSPSVSVTWFQAQELCRANGKRLPTGEEWLAAASGTQDSTSYCNTSSGLGARTTNAASSCVSAWGASEMIGNVAEWGVFPIVLTVPGAPGSA